ncbi:MAG: radical SAM family heme chaperone HemW, partial [Flammeovirgaceae bacterium]
TPSLLNDKEIRQLLNTIQDVFPVHPTAEITLEANPDDLSLKKVNELQQAGINRLSIGIQSFHEPHLRFMNRAHNRNEAINCVKHAQDIGITNISIDLIYGVPTQYDDLAHSGIYQHDIWHQDLAQALALAPKHISAYCLTIESETVFGRWERQHKLPPIHEEFAAEQFEILLSTLADHHYQQYEISNFCLAGWHSKHNSNYWLGVPYLGIGPSAHSFNGHSRQYNVRNNARYIKSLAQQQIPFEKEVLTQADRINEYIMTSLRTSWGCSLDFLLDNCAYDLAQEQAQELDFQQAQGTLSLKNRVMHLTQKGKLLADQVAERFFVSK